jgi:hypothetical protein
LVAYDGSSGADRAIDEAARLFPGARATFVTVFYSTYAGVVAVSVAIVLIPGLSLVPVRFLV